MRLTLARPRWVELPEAEGARLFALQALGKATGHKYIRRVPKPGGGYRYYYSDASTARHAVEGESINTRAGGVLDVVHADHEKVRVRHRETGQEQELTHADLHAKMAAVYRSRFEAGAERMLRRFVREAERVNHDDAQATSKAYAQRFAAAKVPPEHAQRIVSFLAARPGWEQDAKRALLAMASDATIGRRVSANARQITKGAENLRGADGAPKVRAAHVVEAATLRLPKADFDERLVEMRRDAAEELGKAEALLGAIEAAGSNEAARRAMIDYATAMLGARVSMSLERLAHAYPGLRDVPEVGKAHDLQARWDALRAERAGARKPDARGIQGAATTVFVADAEGNPTPQRARYRLVEAGDAVASHDPTKGFKQREDYPEGVQERSYHRDKAEQDKVRTNARKLQPAYVVNTNPDAVNGPPVMTAGGVVLGGNSRTMSLQLAYAEAPDKAQAYKDYLREHAHEFGFAHGDVDAMKAPILVREVDVPDADRAQMGVLVRRYNESFTQGMDPRVDQVARGRMVTEAMLDGLATAMDRTKETGEPLHPTLNAFLSSSEGARFVRDLQSAREGKAIIDRRNRSQYVGKDGKLNEDGKTFVERVLVGHYLPDPDLLSDMLPKHVAAISGVVPHLVRAARNGHDLQKPLRTALEAHAYMRRRNLTSVSEYDRDSGGFAALGVEGFESKPKLDGTSQRLLQVLVDRLDKPVQMAAFVRDFATHAKRNPAGQGDLAGGSRSTDDLLDLASGQQGDRRGQMGLFRSLSMHTHPIEHELPEQIGRLLFLSQLVTKGAGHKYIRRERTGNPKRPWRYYYTVTAGKGIGHEDTIHEGAAFRVKHAGKEGHFHVTKVDGDDVTIRHDESGHTETVKRSAFVAMLLREHAEAIGKAREKAKRDLEAARKHGTPKQVAAREREARKVGVKAQPTDPIKALPFAQGQFADLALRNAKEGRADVFAENLKILAQRGVNEEALQAVRERGEALLKPILDAVKAVGPMPVLTGSEAQVRAAEAVRERKLQIIAAESPDDLADAAEAFKRQTSAGWWLDNKSTDAFDLADRLIAQAEKPAPAIAPVSGLSGKATVESDGADALDKLVRAGIVVTKLGDRIGLSGNTFAHKETIRALGGRWDADRRRWTIPADKIDAVADKIGTVKKSLRLVLHLRPFGHRASELGSASATTRRATRRSR